jgi:hypothetical protein
VLSSGSSEALTARRRRIFPPRTRGEHESNSTFSPIILPSRIEFAGFSRAKGKIFRPCFYFPFSPFPRKHVFTASQTPEEEQDFYRQVSNGPSTVVHTPAVKKAAKPSVRSRCRRKARFISRPITALSLGTMNLGRQGGITLFSRIISELKATPEIPTIFHIEISEYL